MPGGEGRYITPGNYTYGSTSFNISVQVDPSDPIIVCASVRDPVSEIPWVEDGRIVDRRLVVALSNYQAYGSFTLDKPRVIDVYPDHIMTNVPIVFRMTGIGLTSRDRIKIVRGLLCNPPPSERLPDVSPHTWMAVKGGEGEYLSDVNVLGTNATLRMTIDEEYSADRDGNNYILCYLFGGQNNNRWGYTRIGELRVVNR